MLAAGSANVDLLSSCSNHRAQHGHVGDRVRGRTTPHEESHLPEHERDQEFELIVTIDDRRPRLRQAARRTRPKRGFIASPPCEEEKP